MLGRLYAGELKKIVRPKAIIALSVTLIILLLGYAILYNLAKSLTDTLTQAISSGDITIEGEMPEQEEGDNELNAENIDLVIRSYEIQLEQLEDSYKNEKMGYQKYASIFSVKAQLTGLKFIRDNSLYDAKILGFNASTGGILMGDLTAEGFTEDYMSAVTMVMAIYGIVIGAGLLADEYRNGTIKLLLTRPITKNQLITAKLLATLTMCFAFTGLFTLIGYIYGAIAFNVAATDSIYLIFNAAHVVKSTIGAYVFGLFVVSLVRIAAMVLVAYFLGTLSRKKTTGIIVTIIIEFNIISGILGLLPVQIGLLTPNLGLMSYFNAGASVPTYGNFFISLAVDIVYMAAVTFGLYFSVNKRDVI